MVDRLSPDDFVEPLFSLAYGGKKLTDIIRQRVAEGRLHTVVLSNPMIYGRQQSRVALPGNCWALRLYSHDPAQQN